MTGVFIILLITVLQADWENLQDESLKAYGMPLGQLGRLGMQARVANSTLSALAGEQLMEAFRDEWLQGAVSCPKHDGRWSYTERACADPSAFIGRVLREAEARMRSLRQEDYLLLNPTYTYQNGKTVFTADLILTGKSGQELRGTPLALLVHTPIRVTLTTPYLQAAEAFLQRIGEEGLPEDVRREAYDARLRSIQVMAELRGLLQEESEGEGECTRAILQPGAYTLAWIRKAGETFFALRMGEETVFWHQQTPLLLQDTFLGGGDACDSLIRKLREKTGVTKAEGGCLEGEQLAIINLPDGENEEERSVKLSSRQDPPASCRLRERTLRVTQGDFQTPPGGVHLVTVQFKEGEGQQDPIILMPKDKGDSLLARIAYAVEASFERMPRIIPLTTPADARSIPQSLPDMLKDAIEAFYTAYWDEKPIVILIPLGVTRDFPSAYARLQQLLAEPISEGRQPGMPITIPPDALPEDYPLPKLPAGLLQPGVKDPFWLIPLPVAFSMPATARWPLDTVNKISQCAGRVPVEAQEELRYITHTGIDLVPRDQSQREGSGADAFFPPPGGVVHASLPGEVLAWSTLIPRGDQYQRVTFLNTRLLERLENEYGLTKEKLPSWALPYIMSPKAGRVEEENIEGDFYSRTDGWWSETKEKYIWNGMLGETVLVYTPSLHLISVYGHLAPLSSVEQHAVWLDPLSKEARAEGMLPLRVLKRFCAACSFVREDEEGREAYYPLRVALGDPLGLVGNTGNSQAPHLHFELWDVRSLAQRESRSVTPAVRNPFCLLPGEVARCADSACTRTVKVSRVSLYPTAGGLPVDFSSEDAARLFDHAQPGSFAAVCLADELVAQGMNPPEGEWVPPCP